MRVLAAYIGVILLWSTTPLAIKWSGEGPGYLFGATGRMAIGAVCVALAMLLLRQRPAWHRRARLTYLAVAVQIYASMLVVYWASQFIPSGWISVVFGLSPLMTALLAAACLDERSLTPGKLLAYAAGVGGLYVMYGSALEVGQYAVYAIGGVLFSALLQSASAVWIKHLNAEVPALSQVGGGLTIALPAYLLTWELLDGRWPEHLPTTSWAAIVYLGVIATSIGFVLYYYVLQRLPATRVALITLVSPVLALLLGHAANHEPLTPRIVFGAVLILGGLLLHEFSGRFGVKPARSRS
jgi:drug/metabolite transporter (DMT)-like permease